MHEIDKDKLRTTEQIAEFIRQLIGTRTEEQFQQLISQNPELAFYFKASN